MPRISQLPVKSLAAAVDLIPIVDTSTGITKYVTAANLIQDAAMSPQAIKSRSVDISVADQAARDALTPFAGLEVFRLDTKAIEIYTGAAWLSFDTGWQTYTPIFYTNGTAYTLGNGTIAGKYFRTGKRVSVKVRLVMGSSTVWNASGSHQVSLPFASNYNATIDANTPLGNWQAYKFAVASTNGNVELSSTTDRVDLLYFKYGGTANDRAALSNTAPFTSAVGDSQSGQFEYEIA